MKKTADITQVANGFTVSIKQKDGEDGGWDGNYEEYIFSTYEEAEAKIREYFLDK